MEILSGQISIRTTSGDCFSLVNEPDARVSLTNATNVNPSSGSIYDHSIDVLFPKDILGPEQLFTIRVEIQTFGMDEVDSSFGSNSVEVRGTSTPTFDATTHRITGAPGAWQAFSFGDDWDSPLVPLLSGLNLVIEDSKDKVRWLNGSTPFLEAVPSIVEPVSDQARVTVRFRTNVADGVATPMFRGILRITATSGAAANAFWTNYVGTFELP